jgi:hypothetical protein
LCNKDGQYKKSIHRLLAENYIDNPEEKAHVNHIDGCKTNNALSNLEWATPKENANHAAALGLLDKAREQQWVSVLMYSKDKTEFLSQFESLISAQKLTGVPYPNIIKVCKGLRKSAGGYYWEYA